jgi:hypothetical protein
LDGFGWVWMGLDDRVSICGKRGVLLKEDHGFYQEQREKNTSLKSVTNSLNQ